jgi:hypothetical protein
MVDLIHVRVLHGVVREARVDGDGSAREWLRWRWWSIGRSLGWGRAIDWGLVWRKRRLVRIRGLILALGQWWLLVLRLRLLEGRRWH